MTFEEADKILAGATPHTYKISTEFWQHRPENYSRTQYQISIIWPKTTDALTGYHCKQFDAETLALAMAAALDYLQPIAVTVEQEDDGEIENAGVLTAFIASTCGLEESDDAQDWRNECREAVTL